MARYTNPLKRESAARGPGLARIRNADFRSKGAGVKGFTLLGVNMTTTSSKEPTEGDLIFCRWFRHPKTGKRVYARNGKVFAFRKKR